jgi:hypothetical protein
MEAESALFCYVVTTRPIAQKSVCNLVLALHSVYAGHSE